MLIDIENASLTHNLFHKTAAIKKRLTGLIYVTSVG
jgi:hypothetical protein